MGHPTKQVEMRDTYINRAAAILYEHGSPMHIKDLAKLVMQVGRTLATAETCLYASIRTGAHSTVKGRWGKVTISDGWMSLETKHES